MKGVGGGAWRLNIIVLILYAKLTEKVISRGRYRRRGERDMRYETQDNERQMERESSDTLILYCFKVHNNVVKKSN